MAGANSSLVWVWPTESHFLWGLPAESCLCWKLPTEKCKKLHSYPQKDVLVKMLPTQKRFASKVPTENRNCLSLPTKAGFFWKIAHRWAKKAWGYPYMKISLKRMCCQSIFSPSIFCRSLSGTAGSLRSRDSFVGKTWKYSTNLHNPRSYTCPSFDVSLTPQKHAVLWGSWNRVTFWQVSFGMLWTVLQVSLAGFATYWLVKAPVKLTNSTIFADKNLKHDPYKKEPWDPH